MYWPRASARPLSCLHHQAAASARLALASMQAASRCCCSRDRPRAAGQARTAQRAHAPPQRKAPQLHRGVACRARQQRRLRRRAAAAVWPRAGPGAERGHGSARARAVGGLREQHLHCACWEHAACAARLRVKGHGRQPARVALAAHDQLAAGQVEHAPAAVVAPWPHKPRLESLRMAEQPV